MKICGTYKIQSRCKPERIYIGSASDITHRWQSHILDLQKNQHHSFKLQNHYNKYGESDLEFSILLGCEKEDLIKTEQYFIDSYKPWFNICPLARSCLGIKRTEEYKENQRKIQTGKKHRPFTDDHKKGISKALKGRTRSKEWCENISAGKRGKSQTTEHVQKRVAKNTGKKRTEKTKLKQHNAAITRWAKEKNFLINQN